MRVVVAPVAFSYELWDWPNWATEAIRSSFPQLEVMELPPAGVRDHAPLNGNSREVLGAAEVMVAWRLSPEQLAAAPALQWVHCPSAGVHQLLIPELVQRGIKVTNGRRVHGAAVAEHALALMLALTRSLPLCMRAQQAHDWIQATLWADERRPTELAGTTAVLVGVGEIGGQLATRLAALGVHVIGVREHPERCTPGCAEVYSSSDLANLLPRADFVVLALPVTSGTRQILGEEEIARIKPGGCVINVGRGALLDQQALLEALHSGHLRGAALDVFAREPLPADSPLWDCPSLLITPHIGSATPHSWERQIQVLRDNMRRFLEGAPLLYAVDPRLGY